MGLFSTVLSSVGHVTCIVVLVTTNLLISGLDFVARFVVQIISTVTLARIEQDHRVPYAERIRTFQESPELVAYRPNTGAEGGKGPDQVMDEQKTMAATVDFCKKHHPQYFAAAADDAAKKNIICGNKEKLTKLAHDLISNEFGGTNADLLSEDFQFIFPVVGPLTKADFVEAFTNFKVREAFPTCRANFYNFGVDPLEPNRIWCMSRGSYEHLGTLHFGPTKFPPPTQQQQPRVINLPPQMFSMSFDESGRCYKLTGGYNVDRTCGDTQGLGGMFGIITALGGSLPFPEGKPWKRSLLWEALTLRLPQIAMDWRKQLGHNNKAKSVVQTSPKPTDKLLK